MNGSEQLRVRNLSLLSLVIVLVGVASFAAQREFAPSGTTGIAADHAPAVRTEQPRAFTGEEEAYAAALWAIHSKIKMYAVEMSYAGITYATEGRDKARLEAAIQPIADEFRDASSTAEALKAPESLGPVRDRYLAALENYRAATADMLEAAGDGDDGHLLDAQQRSFAASEDLLRVGMVLWPGEYKPH